MKRLILVLLFFCTTAHGDQKLDMLKRHVCQALSTIDGWCSQEKAINFMDLVVEVRPDTCVEIGVFGGSSIFPVASALKFINNGIVIGIDPWDKIECIKYFDPIKDQENLQWWAKINLNHIYYAFLDMLHKHDLENYCKVIKTTSEKAASLVGPIDILYLDGNHSQEVSTRDVELYLPKVRSGGYIWMNDTLWEDRQDAVDLLSDSCDVVKLIDNGNCILFRKR